MTGCMANVKVKPVIIECHSCQAFPVGNFLHSSHKDDSFMIALPRGTVVIGKGVGRYMEKSIYSHISAHKVFILRLSIQNMQIWESTIGKKKIKVCTSLRYFEQVFQNI